MKIFYLDIETYKRNDEGNYEPILNTDEFVLGCIMNEVGESAYFYTPEEMYKYIIKTCEESKEKTQWWGHNHEYDFYGYMKKHLQELLTNNRLKVIRPRPLLAILDEKHYFLDSMSYFPMPLEEAGEMLQIPKKEMPKEIKEIDELREYIQRDVYIVKKGLQSIMGMYRKMGFNPRKLLTSPTTSMNCFITELSKHPKAGWIIKKGNIHKNIENIKFITQANRGGRVEAYHIGTFENCADVDINSAYWETMRTMTVPDLLKERRLTEEEIKIIGEKELLKRIGVIKCKVKVPKNIFPGVLPVRIGTEKTYKQIYPMNEEIITGTWTTAEINQAIENKYKIIEMYEAIIWEKNLNFNPLKEYIEKLWKFRKENKENKLLNHAAKQAGNGLYGKFIQKREDKEYKWIQRTEIEKYLNEGWEIESATEDYCISKKQKEYTPKYASEVLGTLITALTRVRLYNEMIKLDKGSVLYCDTDGLIIKKDQLHKLNIGDEIGQFKIVKIGNGRIRAEKQYMIEDKIKLAGIPKKYHTKEIIESAEEIEMDQMIGFKEAIHFGGFEKTGTFKKVRKLLGEKEEIEIPTEIIEVEK